MKTKLFKIDFLATIGMTLFFSLGCEKDDPVEFAGGIGTETEPFLIETPKQLDAVRHNLNKHFKLKADIDLSGYSSRTSWKPIGFQDDPFTGTIDGDGYKITNVTIDGSETGLFGHTQYSTIKNLGLELVNISAPWGMAGSLVGENKGNIINCYATGEVSSPGSQGVGGLVYWNDGNITNSYTAVNVSGAAVIGGLVGINYDNGVLTDCYTMGNVSATGNIVGGLAGGNYGKINNCFVTGNVSGNERVGGLIGMNDGNITDCYVTGAVSGVYQVGGLVGGCYFPISDCHASGNVSGESVVGGLVGWIQAEHITNCYATGIISATEAIVGGLVGLNVVSDIRSSFATGNVTGDNQVGGLVGLNADEGKITNCYATGAVTGEDHVGGLVGCNGEVWQGYIKNSFAIGAVLGNNNAGGLVGEFIIGEIEYSYFDKETTGQHDTGKGIPKTTVEMMQQSTFETWDFINIWKISQGIGYPYLSWQVE